MTNGDAIRRRTLSGCKRVYVSGNSENRVCQNFEHQIAISPQNQRNLQQILLMSQNFLQIITLLKS
jgi:hypothetical protein